MALRLKSAGPHLLRQNPIRIAFALAAFLFMFYSFIFLPKQRGNHRLLATKTEDAWSKVFFERMRPTCLDRSAIRWRGRRRTALASIPRSGNTMTRALVERATGYQTSTAGYCDPILKQAFLGECDYMANFLVKTHYPIGYMEKELGYTKKHHMDQAVHLVRNPLDSLYSWYMLTHSSKGPDGALNHTARLDISQLGADEEQRHYILEHARSWQWHIQYWRDLTLPVLFVRYEDVLLHRLATVMAIVTFVLPADELPPLEAVACVLEDDAEHDAYKSQKAPIFYTWDKWEPQLRRDVLDIVRDGWCRYGYDVMLRQRLGSTDADDLCKS